MREVGQAHTMATWGRLSLRRLHHSQHNYLPGMGVVYGRLWSADQCAGMDGRAGTGAHGVGAALARIEPARLGRRRSRWPVLLFSVKSEMTTNVQVAYGP